MPAEMKPVAVACGDCDWIYLLPTGLNGVACAHLGHARIKAHVWRHHCAVDNAVLLYTLGKRKGEKDES